MVSKSELENEWYNKLVSTFQTTHSITLEGQDFDVTVASDDIGLANKSRLEAIPSVVYATDAVPRSINGVGDSPHKIETDVNGIPTRLVWKDHMTLEVTLSLQAANEYELAALYNTFKSDISSYEHNRLQQPSSLHTDVTDIRILDVADNDRENAENTIRSDIVEIEIDYEYFHELTSADFDVIDEISIDVDGEVYTIT